MPGASRYNNERSEVVFGVGSWMVCSIGMLVFNKLAVSAFPVECMLVAMQMGVSVILMLTCCWGSLHIGSIRDALRWSMVAPFYTGMLLTSILALKNAPMTLVITFRVLSPLVSLAIERFYPNPLRITPLMCFSIGLMLMGAIMYTFQMPKTDWTGVQWVLLNNFFAIGDRLLQRLMLAKDQNPVDISKTAIALLNNLEGLVPLLIVAWFKHEISETPAAINALTPSGWFYVISSCLVGTGISYTGIWAQSLISATSFLVLVNTNKFLIIFLEAFVLKHKVVTRLQALGALVTVCAGVLYGRARGAIEEEEKKRTITETTPLSVGRA